MAAKSGIADITDHVTLGNYGTAYGKYVGCGHVELKLKIKLRVELHLRVELMLRVELR